MIKLPKLSVCLMVKNEAHVLERCLRSVKDFVDEICITDTGSTDGTRAIAQLFADQYQERKWPHHFGEARNWSLHLATKPFVLVLDADEYIEDPGKMFPVLYRALTQNAGGWRCRVLNKVGDVDDRFWQPRAFRRGAVHYRGRIHHQPKIDQGWAVGRVPERFMITHTGYDNTEAENAAKYGPRLVMLALLCDEAESPSEKAYALYQYGVGQYLAGYPGKALRTMRRVDTDHLYRGGATSPDMHQHRLLIMAKSYLVLSRDGVAFDEQDAATVASRLACHKTPDALVAAGQLAGILGQHKGMLALFCEAFEKAETDSRSMDTAHIVKIIADVMTATGHEDLARDLALKPHSMIPKLAQMV